MEQTQIIIAENGNTELESTFNYPVPCIAGIEPEHLETANFLLAYSRILLKSNDINMILAEKERLQQEDKGLIGLKGFNAFFEAVIQEQSLLIAAVNQQEPPQQIEEAAFKKKSLWEKLKSIVTNRLDSF
ncbi:hypothetical protein [Acetobacterium bakii]|uniref:hypothetical protein n=1 Tax=Acetobacterium bakii TaxID=52689 RepID=UPI000F8D27B0|nr:hypothetical protein [Acetobacterium bakii]